MTFFNLEQILDIFPAFDFFYILLTSLLEQQNLLTGFLFFLYDDYIRSTILNKVIFQNNRKFNIFFFWLTASALDISYLFIASNSNLVPGLNPCIWIFSLKLRGQTGKRVPFLFSAWLSHLPTVHCFSYTLIQPCNSSLRW